MENIELPDLPGYDIIRNDLKSVLDTKYFHTDTKIKQKIDRMQRVLFSCYDNKFYLDCLHILKKVLHTMPLNNMCWPNNARKDIARISFVSLLYYYFNHGDIDEYDSVINIEKAYNYVKEIYKKLNIPMNDDLINCIRIYEANKNGYKPYYRVKYLYPYEPPCKPYTFNLQGCYPFIMFSVDKVERDTDCFTSFEFTVQGYTCVDILWQGPKWDKRKRFPVVEKTLKILNTMLLAIAEASGKFVYPYKIEQVSSVDIFQYIEGYDRPVNMCLGTDFSGQFVGGNIQKKDFTDEDLKNLNNLLVSKYKAKPFIMMFHSARNNKLAGLYVESLMMYCACLEAMVYHWCEEIAVIAGKEDEYKTFSNTEKSVCQSCDLWKQNNKKKNYISAQMLPSVFQYFKFLETECGVTKKEIEELRKEFYRARGKNLRNDVMHGKTDNVSLIELNAIDSHLFRLQDMFINIEKRLHNISQS